jgi:hypothetical protein
MMSWWFGIPWQNSVDECDLREGLVPPETHKKALNEIDRLCVEFTPTKTVRDKLARVRSQS